MIILHLLTRDPAARATSSRDPARILGQPRASGLANNSTLPTRITLPRGWALPGHPQNSQARRSSGEVLALLITVSQIRSLPLPALIPHSYSERALAVQCAPRTSPQTVGASHHSSPIRRGIILSW